MTTYSKLSQEFTKYSLGYSSLGIILSTCLGSIAIMTTLMEGHSFIQMSLVFLTVIICSMHNAAILTVQKPSIIFRLLVISSIFNSLIITYNAIF